MTAAAYEAGQPGRQPGLRSFIVYDTLPDGMAAFRLPDDRLDPHLRAGEFAVIDPGDREPMHGELFLVQFTSGPSPPRIFEAFQLPGRETWGVRETRLAPILSLTGKVLSKPIRWGDFGYTREHLERLIIGRVIGIFAQPRAGLSPRGGM